MSILEQLSSQVGDRTEAANRRVVADCVEHPELLQHIVQGLDSTDKGLVGDAAEVLTQVAESHPAYVSPYAPALVALLNHKATRVRWEAMHALALVAHLTPDVVVELLPKLREMQSVETSTIVRDYAVELLGNYAIRGETASTDVYPLLVEALEGKQRSRALQGLLVVATHAPSFQAELHQLAARYLDDLKAGVKKAAIALHKATL
ncbi:hypothetical protein [Tumebacillus permanentifrigoris]|uniref:HEAT repeat protein n=1 Tax=Tumebacillus permanentifrigoris TaxID=378543 RepID=A0A316DAD5_9BACL|nr:hypothetical protein [Tumebacillus permanentifrigoris]PWK12821.1 hypothetical protein C7459_109183 [Tumebacillus permanentifrigoris]